MALPVPTKELPLLPLATCDVLPFCLEMNTTNACKRFEVLPISSIIFLDGAEFVSTGFGYRLGIVNGQDGHYHILPKPPWLLCANTAGSWFKRAQLIAGFLLAASPWFLEYITHGASVLQTNFWSSFIGSAAQRFLCVRQNIRWVPTIVLLKILESLMVISLHSVGSPATFVLADMCPTTPINLIELLSRLSYELLLVDKIIWHKCGNIFQLVLLALCQLQLNVWDTLSLACARIVSPSVLFADELTLGLAVLKTLRQLAEAGHIVICSVHQPRGSVYSTLAVIVLLSEVEVVYMRTITEESLSYSASLGYQCPDHINAAEFWAHFITVDYISAETVHSSQKRIEDLIEKFANQILVTAVTYFITTSEGSEFFTQFVQKSTPHETMLYLCILQWAWIYQQPWPPPMLLEYWRDSVLIRPMPWPNFLVGAPIRACIAVGNFQLEVQIGWVKRDTHVLMSEPVRLRQKPMISFLDTKMQNTGFHAQFLQQYEIRIRK